jgi:hypothetical protein
MTHTMSLLRGRERAEPVAVTALFDSANAVDAALARLYNAGVPWDLMEVVVSRSAAERFYSGLARTPGREVFRYAGIGGLVGLIVGATISLVMLALLGEVHERSAAIVQLLGPNFMTIVGALLGGVYGLFQRRPPQPYYARLAEATSAILVAVAARTTEQTEVVKQILVDAGGREPRVEGHPRGDTIESDTIE